ncbi:MAG: hypothetical protein AAB897_03035 [Patescibacteria group bacterium]
MFTFLLLAATSILLVLLAERYETSRRVLYKASAVYTQGTCRSFIFDVFLLLPLVGMLVEFLVRRLNVFTRTTRRSLLYAAAISVFVGVAGSLYFDYLDFSFLSSIFGHGEIWSGNRFMWNSGLEIVGVNVGDIFGITFPTYLDRFGFWNIAGIFLLVAVYPLLMIYLGTRFYGMLFGYSEKQTGTSVLFFEWK